MNKWNVTMWASEMQGNGCYDDKKQKRMQGSSVFTYRILIRNLYVN
jgi:hypothetical protein